MDEYSKIKSKLMSVFNQKASEVGFEIFGVKNKKNVITMMNDYADRLNEGRVDAAGASESLINDGDEFKKYTFATPVILGVIAGVWGFFQTGNLVSLPGGMLLVGGLFSLCVGLPIGIIARNEAVDKNFQKSEERLDEALKYKLENASESSILLPAVPTLEIAKQRRHRFNDSSDGRGERIIVNLASDTTKSNDDGPTKQQNVAQASMII